MVVRVVISWEGWNERGRKAWAGLMADGVESRVSEEKRMLSCSESLE